MDLPSLFIAVSHSAIGDVLQQLIMLLVPRIHICMRWLWPNRRTFFPRFLEGKPSNDGWLATTSNVRPHFKFRFN